MSNQTNGLGEEGQGFPTTQGLLSIYSGLFFYIF